MFIDITLNYTIELTQLTAPASLSNSTHDNISPVVKKSDLDTSHLAKLKELLHLLKHSIPAMRSIITSVSSNKHAFLPACVSHISYLCALLGQSPPPLTINTNFTISPVETPPPEPTTVREAQDTLLVTLSASVLSVSPGKEFRAPLNFPLLTEV